MSVSVPFLSALGAAVARAKIALVVVSGAALVATVAPLVAPVAADAAVPSCSAAGIGLSSLGGPNFYIDTGATPAFTSSYTGYTVTNSTGAPLDDVWVSLSNFTGGALGLASGQSAGEQIAHLPDGSDQALYWYLTALAGGTSTAQDYTVTVYQHNPALPDSAPLCSATDGFATVAGTLDASANKVTGVSVSGGTPTLGSTFTVSVTGTTGTIGSGIAGDTESFWMSPAVASTWPADAFRLIGTSLTISPDGSAPDQTYTNQLRLANLGSAARPYTAAYTFRAIGFTAGSTPVQPVQEIASGTQVKHTGSYPASIPPIAAPTNNLSMSASADPSELGTDGGDVTVTATLSGTAGASVDSLVVTPPADATLDTGSASFDGQPIPDPTASGGTWVFSGPFTLGGAHAPLKFGLQLPGTPGKRTTSVVATLGTAQIGTDTTDVSGASPATAVVTVDTPPSATTTEASASTAGTSTIDVADAVSDPDADTVTVTSASADHGTLTWDGTTLTYTPTDGYTGPDVITYTVSDGRGGTATGQVDLTVTTLTAQTITFPALDDLSVGQDEQAAATSDSGLPVGYTSKTPDVCTVGNGGTVAAVASGTCTIAADQAGNDTYAPADTVTRSLTVTGKAQHLTFAVAHVLVAGGAGYPPAATSDDPQATVTYAAGPAAVCRTKGGPDGGTLLDLVGAGTCTVTASAAGDDHYSAATDVERKIAVITPADVTVPLPASTGRAAPHRVDVLHGIHGLNLTAVGRPRHGNARVVGNAIRVVPDVTFRGRDRFTYTVTDQAQRTAKGTVTLLVADARPTARNTHTRQIAGTTVAVTVPARDLNRDRLALSPATRAVGVHVSARGRHVRIRTAAGVSGRVTVSVHVADGAGGTTTARITDTVIPAAAVRAVHRLDGHGTRISWTLPGHRHAPVTVTADGHRVCATRADHCHTDRLLGPHADVEVTVHGRDATTSAASRATYRRGQRVLVATVYFASARWTLDRPQRSYLARIAHRLTAGGFTDVAVRGYTDAFGSVAYNKHLSHQRTATVAGILKRRTGIRSSESWFGERHPVASSRTARGAARNRRVEIYAR